jgi:hypothetical protein
MMTDTPTALRDSDFMQAFLDVVIPPGTEGQMPGAGSLGLAAAVADALEADPVLGPVVEAGLEAVRATALTGDPGGLPGLSPQARVRIVDAQVESQPWLMLGVARYLYPAYYQHPRVLEGLGEPPRPPFPEGFEIEPTDPRLLEKLRPRQRD